MFDLRTLLCGILAVSATVVSAATTCGAESQPNPIPQASNSTSFPISGTVNGTIAILPISYQLARSIIPSQYPILTAQYQKWLPWLPSDQYPAMLQAELDHDIYIAGKPLGLDFQRASISFPFVDRLSNGYTAMAFNNEILISASASAVYPSFEELGYNVTAAVFDPNCEAYAYVNKTSAPSSYRQSGPAVYSKAYANTSLSVPGIAYEVAPVAHSPYSINFWNNVTNQPLFSYNTSICDHFVRLLNTSISDGQYAPVNVRGGVSALAPYFAQTRRWRNVFGLKLDQAFRESGGVPCGTLAGVSVADAPS